MLISSLYMDLIEVFSEKLGLIVIVSGRGPCVPPISTGDGGGSGASYQIFRWEGLDRILVLGRVVGKEGGELFQRGIAVFT